MRQRPEDQRSVMRSERRSNWRLRLEKELDDHGIWRLALVGALVLALAAAGGWLIGGSKRPSFAYGIEVMRVAALDLFGGEQAMDNGLDILQELMIFQDQGYGYDAFDIAATSLYGTSAQLRLAFFKNILKRDSGRIRILMLDPRLALDAGGKAQFDALSALLGDSPEVTFLQCWLSTFAAAEAAEVLKRYGDRFEVRFYRTPVAGAKDGYFLPGVLFSKYFLEDPARRFDIIVPYGNSAESGIDSPLRRAWRIKDAPQNAKVKAYARAFETAWRTAVPLDEVVRGLPSPLTMRSARDNSRKEQ